MRFSYSVEEALNVAIMTTTPLVIVEGHDDIQFYEKICSDAGMNYDVFAIETFEGCSEGCEAILLALQQIQDEFMKNPSNLKYLLGIVDRDARFYRNEIPKNLQGLLMLKYYSFESHLITDYNIIKSLPSICHIGVSSINDEVLRYIKSGFENLIYQLYYLSLEALKNACVREYSNEIGYSDPEGKITNDNSRQYFFEKVMQKKNELDLFAAQNNLNLDNFLYIVKGKWLLSAFSNFLLSKIKLLPQACSEGLISSCQYCRTDKPSKCLWNLKAAYNYNQIKNILMQYYEETEIAYIKERLRTLMN